MYKKWSTEYTHRLTNQLHSPRLHYGELSDRHSDSCSPQSENHRNHQKTRQNKAYTKSLTKNSVMARAPVTIVASSFWRIPPSFLAHPIGHVTLVSLDKVVYVYRFIGMTRLKTIGKRISLVKEDIYLPFIIRLIVRK